MTEWNRLPIEPENDTLYLIATIRSDDVPALARWIGEEFGYVNFVPHGTDTMKSETLEEIIARHDPNDIRWAKVDLPSK